MGLSTIQYLKKELPDTKLIYGVPKWIAPLYQDVQTAADEILPLEFKTMADWFKTRSLLKERKVDTVLELFQSGRTAKFFKLWQGLAGPRYVFHNHHSNDGVVHDQGVIKSNIQRDLDGAWTFFGKSETPPSFLDFSPHIERRPKEKGHIVLGVVATRETKMWPLKNYIELTQKIKERFPDTKILIPLGPGDGKIENELTGNISDNSEIIKVPLSQLPEHLAGAMQYIGNDTGLKHICVALGVPTFTMFGPEPPTEWHPYDSTAHPYYFREPLECRTRNAHYCGLSQCDSMICLNELSPEALLNIALKD